MWSQIEAWGRNNPVILTVIAALVGAGIGGIPAGFAAYNLGFYAGVGVTEDSWKSKFDLRVAADVRDQGDRKCAESVSAVTNSCQTATRNLQLRLDDKDRTLATLQQSVDRLVTRSDILDIHDNLISNANSILSALISAREKRDRTGEATGRNRAASLVQDISRINQIYSDWAGLFNHAAAELAERARKGEPLSLDEIQSYLRGFISDNERKRKVIQSEVDSANKIKGNKY